MFAEGSNSLVISQVGLPAKSGVAGGILLVVPNVMGLMCWSPPLDKMGNSVKGIHFCHVSSIAFSWEFFCFSFGFVFPFAAVVY